MLAYNKHVKFTTASLTLAWEKWQTLCTANPHNHSHPSTPQDVEHIKNTKKHNTVTFKAQEAEKQPSIVPEDVLPPRSM